MYAKLIDNKRKSLKEVLLEIMASDNYQSLSIATGYWDLPGMIEIIDELRSFKSIRLLIGQEPLPHRLVSKLPEIEQENEQTFPDANFAYDLEEANKNGNNEESNKLRETARKLAELIKDGILEVRVFRSPRLHAKAYIFGEAGSESAVGIIGSSNFTKAGLEKNAELNYLEEDHTRVLFEPTNIEQGHGHLSWFNELWDDDEAVEWSGDFTEIIEKSPVGDMTYGPYDVYIKTLMEVFPDELLPKKELTPELQDVLYAFQDRNAGILLNKLHKHGVAMLSDSVGLGKTVTAGAVIKSYQQTGCRRIMVITPASLLDQWQSDLGTIHNIDPNDVEYVSMQNVQEHNRLVEESLKTYTREVELFVIDEAHNLRNPGSTRYESILELLEASPSAPVLLLTATPVNNSLIDLANQIRLGMRGSMESVAVPYFKSDDKMEVIDFFDVLERVQSEIAKAEKNGETFDWKRHESSLKAGIRQYLVRSTRQAVEEQGSLVLNNVKKHFPKTKVNQLPYKYDEKVLGQLFSVVLNNIETVFEGINPLKLNLDVASNLTQQSMHPLDLLAPAYKKESMPKNLDGVPNLDYSQLFTDETSQSLIPSLFQIINFLGFTPYRVELYKRAYYGKSQEEIRALGLKDQIKRRVSIQRTIHNMLQITWLKRLESSASALLKSVQYYSKRLELFESYLEKGYIIPLNDVEDLESEYGDDIDRAFSDYEKAFEQIQKAQEQNEDISKIALKGVERIEATEKEFCLDELKNDIKRDKKIVQVLEQLLDIVQDPKNNGKLNAFADHVLDAVKAGANGNKILVFSFFADTIEYLQNSLPQVLKDNHEFINKAAFISGKDRAGAENIASRFSPISKKYDLKDGETEIDYLFATDVLSEGQNLQDAGILINYDLHWNPVRMIQRNGRINRLGSPYEEVAIVNMKPHDDLEAYLKLLRRLERKIDTIKNSIGTDQSILGEKENPIEFVDYYSDDSVKATAAAQAAEESIQSGGILNNDNEFQFELRKFLDTHPVGDPERERIESISAGKWNYLPTRPENKHHQKMYPALNLEKDDFIALEKVNGHGVITGKEFSTTIFVKVKAEGRYYHANPIEEVEALQSIRTTPDDNSPTRDVVSNKIDRYKIAKRAREIAKTKAISTDNRKELKPSQEKALKAMKEFFPPNIDLLGIISRGIRLEQDNREFKKLVRLINSEIKENGSVFSSTVTRFEKLINKIKSQAAESQEADEVYDILFYANK